MVGKIDVDGWLKSRKYLPRPLRDFHAQKDLFRAMHEIIAERPDDMIKRPSWIEGQVYVIEVFLWFMARRGYTLQKARQRGNFRDLESDVRAMTAERNAASSAALKEALEGAGKGSSAT